MAERRGRGEDAVYYDHMGTVCRDAKYHRSCSGRWRGEVNLGKDSTGKRIRRKVSAKNKTEVYSKLAELRDELGQGIRSAANYTVEMAITEWLASITDRSQKTVATLTELLECEMECEMANIAPELGNPHIPSWNVNVTWKSRNAGKGHALHRQMHAFLLPRGLECENVECERPFRGGCHL